MKSYEEDFEYFFFRNKYHLKINLQFGCDYGLVGLRTFLGLKLLIILWPEISLKKNFVDYKCLGRDFIIKNREDVRHKLFAKGFGIIYEVFSTKNRFSDRPIA